MHALTRKLLRNIWSMRGQTAAIALVMTCGVAVFIMSLSTLDSLRITRQSYYQDYRFADVFASLKRAPQQVEDRIRQIPGIEQVEARVVAGATLSIEEFPEPIRGQINSYPDERPPRLNQLYVREGRLLAPYASDEILVSDGFADAHGLVPGDQIQAVINGRQRDLTIVGIVLSPEYIYQMAPGAVFPDYKRFGVLWMNRSALAAAYDMEGAFNSVVLGLSAGSSARDVIDRLDLILDPYGGLGAYAREDQQSHFFLSEEFRQLESFATMLPAIFLGVAAFLLNVVVRRLIQTQREEIAVLKAFGYSNWQVGAHYLQLVGVMISFGILGGIACGVWLGQGLAELYQEFYRFPYLEYELHFDVVWIAVLISAAAAAVGTLHAVYGAVRLPPAEAMRPEPPARYHVTLAERAGLKQWMSQPSRMILRHLERRPIKALLSTLGIAFACATILMGRFSNDSIDFLVDVQFQQAQREDMTVTFLEPTTRRVLYDLHAIEGVHYQEPFRAVAVQLRHDHRSRRMELQGLEPGSELTRLLDTDLDPIQLPPEGIILTEQVAEILESTPGDTITVEVLEGTRGVHKIPVARVVRQFIGLGAYMDLEALNAALGEGPTVSGAYLTLDSREQDRIFTELKEAPRVAGVGLREASINDFYESVAENQLMIAFIITIFAGAIAFAVVYNNARISLSERSRELASLRILGFTRAEISYILLGELAIITLLAIPLGFLVGWGLLLYIVRALATDLYRIPLVIGPETYAFAAVLVLATAVISGLIVRRRLNRLDLIGVLKTRE